MRLTHITRRSTSRPVCRLFASTLLFAVAGASAVTAHAAIGWDGGGNTNWWFDPVNWSREADAGGPFLPPSQGQPVVATDAQINGGSGDWDVTSEGVVYDPANDPFFDEADELAYPTGSPLTTLPSVLRDYGPETIYRLYISRNTLNHNLMTVKSGDLVVESTTIIGRSGSTGTAAAQQNLGTIVQTGGSLRFPNVTVDLGQRETSGWGNGVFDYRGGTFEVGGDILAGSTTALRLSHGSTTAGVGPGGMGRLIVRNPASGGHILLRNLNVASYAGLAEAPAVFDPAMDPDGVTTGVGTVEFRHANGGVRPVQILRNLTLNNGLDEATMGTRSSRLEIVLDSAPSAPGGIPANLGLFDTDFDADFSGGVVGGGGAMANTFSSADGSAQYAQGAMVSATLGATKYNWTISYTGTISWTDAANSVVSSVIDDGLGFDVVLIGHSTQTVAVNNADFNGDGEVDGRDFLIWQRGVGVGTTLGQGDANGSNSVNGADLTIWKTQFGQAVAAVSAVPEPGAAALATLGLATIAITRRRGS